MNTGFRIGAVALFILLPVTAQANHEKALTMQQVQIAEASGAEADQEFKASMATMHEKMMDVKSTGNVDVDFVRQMIAHHQGAVDMAKTELKYGQDAQIKEMAQNIIKAQEEEISMMKAWLKKNGQ